jgi:radical SAM protein with 4Fe4S-binding SPASM domain
MFPEDNINWCGGDGQMLAVDPNGELFPCIRYMESSLGDE